MPKLSPISAKSLITILEELGFVQIRQKGSHLRMEHPDGRKTTVPTHPGEQVGTGLLRKILRDSNISRSEFERLRK